MLKEKGKSQYLAVISLLMMAVGFLATIPMEQSIWVSILQGAFEAGLVGGLADWFAVTALFRHPLGLPIPHTALLPKNREKIIAKIISMLENDWLTKESIRNKIDTFPLAERIFSLIERELPSDSVKERIVTLLQHFIETIDLGKLSPIIEKELKKQLSNFDLKHYLSLLIDQVRSRNYDQKTLDYVLKEIDDWAKKEDTKFRLGSMAVEMIENIKADGIIQFALRSFSNLINEEKLGNLIQNLILKGVDSFRDPNNQNRRNLLNHIHQKLESLKTDEKLYQELEQFKSQVIEKWDAHETIMPFLTEAQQKALTFTGKSGFYADYILPFLQNSLKELKADSAKMTQLENWIKSQISLFVDKNHSRIGQLVKENLDKLDTKTLTNMIETNVGRDLQWIRVNGAVCGFLIGLILTAFKVVI